MATRNVTVQGERNLINEGEINNSLVILGDKNTVDMHLEGTGAVLAFAFRWNRPRARKRGDRPQPPPPFELHVDREAELAALTGNDGAPRVVNLYGETGAGKTHVLVEALQRRECEGRDGTVYIRDASGRSADDLLHAVFSALFETRVPIRASEIERHLTKPRAVVALEDVDSGSDSGQRLIVAFPASRLFVTSRERVLYDGTPLKLAGLDPEHAVTIAEQELGRRLDGAERAAAETIAAALRGHPFELRRAFGRARDEGAGRPLRELAPVLMQPASGHDRAAALDAAQLAVARTLAVHGGEALGAEHLAVLAGPSAPAAAQALEARHDARSHSPRYSIEGPLTTAFSDDELAGEVDRALAHFIPWAEDEARLGNHDAVLREGRALVALLERAAELGRLEDVISLGFAIEGAFAWGNRWAEWGRVLEIVLGAARNRADDWAEATALHQLGTRAYGLGNARESRSTLERALDLRERIGDKAGAAATRGNLRVVSGPAPLLYRLSHASLVVVAAVVAMLVVGVGGAVGAGIDGGGQDRQVAVEIGGDGRGSVVSDIGQIRCEPTCDATFADGGDVVLIPRPARGSQFIGWRGGTCNATAECRLRLTADVRATAIFKKLADPQPLRVRVDGDGTVTSEPAARPCTGTCEWTFGRGKLVRLSAVPRQGFSFDGWSQSCEGSGRCVVAMEGSRTVLARFVRTPPGKVALSVAASPTRGGDVSGPPGSGVACGEECNAELDEGSTVELTAKARDGYALERWVGGGCSGQELTCEVTLDESQRVVAIFSEDRGEPLVPSGEDPAQPREHTLSVRFADADAGRVTSEPAGIDCPSTCREAFPAGEPVTLTATESRGWTFVGWDGDCSGQTCEVAMDEPAIVAPRFERTQAPPREYGLLVRFATPDAGRVRSEPAGIDCPSTCRKAFPAGEPVTLTATESRGWTFVGWDGDCSGQTCEVAMDGPTIVAPRFERRQAAPSTFTLRTSATNGRVVVEAGSGDVPDDCSNGCRYRAGTNVTLRASADDPYTQDDPAWTDCTENQDNGRECTATMDSDRTVRVVFPSPPS